MGKTTRVLIVGAGIAGTIAAGHLRRLLPNSDEVLLIDRSNLQTTHAGVGAAGDVTTIALAMGKPLPKAGTFAEAQAKVAAQNIAHDLTREGRSVALDGRGQCLVETGGGVAAYGGGNFLAEPLPLVTLRRSARFRHLAKVAVECFWLLRWS